MGFRRPERQRYRLPSPSWSSCCWLIAAGVQARRKTPSASAVRVYGVTQTDMAPKGCIFAPVRRRAGVIRYNAMAGRVSSALPPYLWRTTMSGTRLFSPFEMGNLTLRNRIVIAPMCQYRPSMER